MDYTRAARGTNTHLSLSLSLCLCVYAGAYIYGPRCVVPGQRLIGVASTLAFLPKREDVEEGMEEEESGARVCVCVCVCVLCLLPA